MTGRKVAIQRADRQEFRVRVRRLYDRAQKLHDGATANLRGARASIANDRHIAWKNALADLALAVDRCGDSELKGHIERLREDIQRFMNH